MELTTVDEKDKQILKLEASVLSLKKQNEILNFKYDGMQSKRDLLLQVRSLMKNKPEQMNNLFYYEEGRIEALLWVLGLSNKIKIEEIERILENV